MRHPPLFVASVAIFAWWGSILPFHVHPSPLSLPLPTADRTANVRDALCALRIKTALVEPGRPLNVSMRRWIGRARATVSKRRVAARRAAVVRIQMPSGKLERMREVGRLVGRLVGRSVDQSVVVVGRSFRHLVDQSVSRSVGRSADPSSADQPVVR